MMPVRDIRKVLSGVGMVVTLSGALCLGASMAHAEILKPPPRIGADKAEKASPKPGGRAETKTPAAQQKPNMSRPRYTKDYVGGMKSYTAKYEDTMVQIARDFNVGFVELRAANPFLDPWIPGEGKKVIIPDMHLLPDAPREGIVMNLSEMRMYLYDRPGQPPKTYPIGIGREGLQTPLGTTTVIGKREGPTWRPTPRMREENPALPAVVPPGPDNPMGTHAMYLGWPTYAIHGTDKPYSIGRRASAGCIRMYPEDIVNVFGLVRSGTAVTVVNQSVKTGWKDDKFYLEAHPTMEQADQMEVDGGLPGYVFPEEDMGMIVSSAGEYADDLDWRLIRQVIRERRGYPVEIFQRPVKVAAEDQAVEKSAGKESDKGDSGKEDAAKGKSKDAPKTDDSNTGATGNAKEKSNASSDDVNKEDVASAKADDSAQETAPN